MEIKAISTTLFCLILPPCRFKNWLLCKCGWEVDKNCMIGFSFVKVGHAKLAENTRVGHGNLINNEAIILSKNSRIGHLNRIRGPFLVILSEYSCIGNQNKITRAVKGVTWGKAIFKLGKWSKITTEHIVDCTRSVTIGDFSTVAGARSQLWTHGYLHAPNGIGRFRTDGAIRIGNNVYIGSACVFNAGVNVADAITVGSGSCISRSLVNSGLYVSQPLRYIELDYEQANKKYRQVKAKNMVEKVINKGCLNKSI